MSTSARVSGALSRNPFGPDSQQEFVDRVPCGGGLPLDRRLRGRRRRCRRASAARRCAQARPASRPRRSLRGARLHREVAYAIDGHVRHTVLEKTGRVVVRLLAQVPVEHHRDVAHEHPADGRDLDGGVAHAARSRQPGGAVGGAPTTRGRSSRRSGSRAAPRSAATSTWKLHISVVMTCRRRWSSASRT